MILPIYTYGQPVLRERAREVEGDSPELQALIADMLDTMRNASGIGLAAPQVGHSIRLFVMDASPQAEDVAEENGGVVPEWARGPLALINPALVPDDGYGLESAEEGCLSLPDVREWVARPDRVRLRFLDRRFQPHEAAAHGLLARVVQHELDHLEGVLHIDRISPLRKRLLQRRLRQMARGEVEAEYPLAPLQA